MARIRTIKPELWTDPEFVECSLSARLLFIAMWNFASDYGVIPNKPRQLKMQCLPADDCDIGALIEELVSAHFIYPATAPNGDNVLVIRTFSKNQKINRRTKGRWGDPDEWPQSRHRLNEDSVRTHGAPPPGRDSTDSSDNSDNSDLPVAEIHSPAPDGRINQIIEHIAAIRIEQNPAKSNPTNYRRAVIASVRADHTERIHELAVMCRPDTPISVLAGAAESGDTRHLAHWLKTPEPPAEPERRLTADERKAVLANARAETTPQEDP